MKWPLVTSLFVIGITVANGYWGSHSSDDPTYSHLGFYILDMKCNDAGTYCQKCYIAHCEWNVAHMHVHEFTDDPAQYVFRCIEGNQDWKISVIQADLAQPYRICTAWSNYTMDAQLARIDVCVDNSFEGVEVPPECPRPVIVLSLDYHVADKTIRGLQSILCASP
ncbi:uncharacterized protein LOC119724091 [Patiria miniata]|uniref:Uncharacterized protein n=1 Tax=Patiria miniata TaxID=46514 RepID=A0A913ZGM0_PATMI|nr:uncharacterized protein LOC119724091 [Patiria miniata]